MSSKVFLYLRIFQLFFYSWFAYSQEKAHDCVDLLEKGFKKDGVYLIDPDNQGSFHVFCDQTTNGGGWIVFQKRFDGSEDFYRNWTDYKNGFGRLDAEFWLGNDKIHRLTNKHQQLLVELEDFDNITAYAQYDYFSVDSEVDWYELHLGSYDGTAGNSLFNGHNKMKFSTKDKDNDEHDSMSCSSFSHGGWWYKRCASANFNGKYTRKLTSSYINVFLASFRDYFPLKSTSMKMRGFAGTEWDYAIALNKNDNLAHARIMKLPEIKRLTACWWMKLLSTEVTQHFTVLSIDEPSRNNSFAFAIQGHSAFRLTVNATDYDFSIPEVNILDNSWHHLCLMGPFDKAISFYVDGVRKKATSFQPNSFRIQPSVLRIGISSENSTDGVSGTVRGHLSQLNIWSVKKWTIFIREKSRGCIAQMGNLIPWSVVQFWLHDNVTKTSPSACTSADNIHWSLSRAIENNVTDDSSLWQGNVVGDGVELDTEVMSLQGRGHVILGRFDDFCPGNPSLCEEGFTVSFWMKHGVKFTSYILGQNEEYHEALESMVSAVTPNNSKWTRCYNALSDGFTAHAFHSRCDNKGPTITLVQVREFIFGGFLDQNWGGPNNRTISSDSAFLFSINNPLGLQPFKIDVKEVNKTVAATSDPTKGPLFGIKDLWITFDNLGIPRHSESQIGNAYSLPEGYDQDNEAYGFGLFAETISFTWDDFEVFYYDVPHEALGVGEPAVTPDSAFDSSSERISLNYSASKSLSDAEGEWCTYYRDTQQWLQANISYESHHVNNLNQAGRISVETSKPTSEASWVISYKLNESTNGEEWTMLKNNNGKQVFEIGGTNWFTGRPPFLRLLPQTWNSDICMKVKIKAVSGGHLQATIPDMTASSERCMTPPHFARLNFPGPCLSAWCSKPRSEDPHPWLRVSLGNPQYILFVATQSSNSEQNKYFVLSYYLSFVNADDGKWKNYTEKGKLKVFEGNWDGSTVVKNAILNPFKTQTLKFKIVHWTSEECCLRVEIYGPECQGALGMQSGAISDTQINASSECSYRYAANQGRLNLQATEFKKGVWIPAKGDVNPWLQVDVGNHYTKVTRVATQGRNYTSPLNWVTKYKLQYSHDGANFQYYREQGQTRDKVFTGNTDRNTVVYHHLNPPITARYIRFRPVAWHAWIAMRVELFGCLQGCKPKALGMENREISDSQISASTEYSDTYAASYGRLNVKHKWAWSSLTNDVDQWLQIDLRNEHTRVMRVATQGNIPYFDDEYVTSYKLQYSNDEKYFYYYREQGQSTDKIFAGNTDANTVVSHDLNPPITARYVRFRPVTWVAHISMKVEVYGCLQGCDLKALGMENGAISDSQISASSEYSQNLAAIFGRLNGQEFGRDGWAPRVLDSYQWLQIDLRNQDTSVMRVATQGRAYSPQWVTSYKLQYCNDIDNLHSYKAQGQSNAKVFAGNTDGRSVVSHDLNPPITARYIRFLPVTWHSYIAMRVELYGRLRAVEKEIDPGTIVSWRTRNTNTEDKREFEYKQVNGLFSRYHQLSVTSGDEVYKLDIPTIPTAWHHVTFTWSKTWGLKFYQNGVLVSETGRAQPIVKSATNPTDGMFIIGNRFLTSGVKTADNFQLHGLTVWPRLVSQAQIKNQLENVTCRMTDWCLRQSSNDDFDWSIGTNCTETEKTGPCNDADLNNEVKRSFSNAAFKAKTQQHPNTGNSSLLPVDGNLDTWSELGPTSNPWLKVDLGREGLVTGVRLTLSVINFGSDKAIVNVTVTNHTGDRRVCTTVQEYVVMPRLVNLVVRSCDEPLLGRFVQVEMMVASICSTPNCEFVMLLNEVEVMLEQSTGFYYIEASSPRVEGDKARLKTKYILPRYNCLAFSYHMRGPFMGRLNVYLHSYKSSEILLWRLSTEQSKKWQRAEIPIRSNNTFKVIFEAIVSGEEGDIAIDEVTFTRDDNCSFIPEFARSTYSEDFRSDIIGHIPAYMTRLESWLTSVGFQGKLWKPCYSAAKDGWNSSVFHKKCDGKGATLTIARFDNTIFGGFADHSWGSFPDGFRVSTKSFLFRFEKKIGQAFEEVVLGLDQVFKGIQWSKERGPIFGNEELAFSSDMRHASISENSLLRENNVSLHAIEVLTTGDTLCARQCPLYQYCNEIRGWCSWDLAFREARFCDSGHSTSYWPLDNHLNLVNLRRDMWGKFVGDVGTTHGPRLGAVYTHGDVAVIKLGEVDDVCFTEPMSCNNGFTVSLWLKQRRAHYIKPEQLLVAIGDYKNGSYTLKVFIKSKRPEEHLGVRVSASSRKCVKIFLVPRSVWSLFTFVWNTTDVNVYRNGLKVNEFLVEYCVDEQSQGALQHPTITLKGDAMFDDLQIWSRALSANEIGEMFACVRAPSWTCAMSDWTESFKTEGWSRCSEEISFVNGLQRGENGGLEDFVDRLEGAWCCSLPSQYKYHDLKCKTEKYFENWSGKHGYLGCKDGKFIRGIHRLGGSQASFDVVQNVECCKPAGHPSSHEHCYQKTALSFDKRGLAKCRDNYYLTQIRITKCRQLYCIDRFTCCKMEKDNRDDNDLDMHLEAKLLDEVWNINLTDPLHDQFYELQNKIESQIWSVYNKAYKKRFVDTIVIHSFWPGSVKAKFSIIFNIPDYEMIRPLLAVINQTVDPTKVNYLGDMAIQLLYVEAVNVYEKSLNTSIVAINGSTLHINWEFAEENPSYGIFQGYQVLYSKDNDITKDFLLGMDINDNITQAWFVGDACQVYSFKVRAYSLEGYGKLSEAVNAVTPCEAVKNVTAVSKNSSSIFLQWEPAKGNIFTGYNVTYSLVKEGPTWHVVLQRKASWVNLVNLRGITTYRIKVGLLVADNEIVWSEEVLCSTPPGAPSAPPQDVSAYNLSSTSVNITWFPVPSAWLNGILKRYLVFYREASAQVTAPTEIAVYNTSLNAVIQALKKFTVYSVWVQAVTARAGPSSAPLNVSTDEDVPSAPPSDVTAFNVSSTIIRVLWQPVPADHIHGVLLGYHVEYHKVGRAKRSVTMETVNDTSLSVHLRDLDKFSEYRIMVRGFTSRGEGNQSEIKCWTDEDVPDSPPTNISVRSTTSTVLEVSWKPVHHANQNGIILGYHVLLLEAWGESLRNVTVQNSSQSYYQFQGLKEWTNYSVQVSAFTSKGNGPFSSSLLASTDEDVPLVAPTLVTGHNTSSTSIRVAWQPVSPDDVNIRGIHRGYSIYYVPASTPRPSVLKNVTVDILTTHVQLMNLYKFTKYDIYVTVRTRWDGLKSQTITVSTDEGTPDLPPADITAAPLGKKAIIVRWRPVPFGYRGGIITGYRITYNSSNSTTRWRNASRDASHIILTSLMKFTFYDVYVQAHTIKGNGPAHHIKTATDMGVPNEAPPGLTAEKWGTTHSVAIKWQLLLPSNNYGILNGYRVRYQLTASGEENIKDTPVKELVTNPETNQVLLENLVMYGTYSVWVSAFTVKGDGPASFTYAETCRCDKHLTTNWRKLAPYLNSTITSLDVPHPGGILPGIIHDMVVTCCATCKTHGQALVDFNLDCNGEASEKQSDSHLRRTISHRTHFSFPIPGYMEQDKYGVDLGYWPLVQTPGVAYIVNTGVGTSPADALNNTLTSCWPALLLVFVMSLLAGFLMWIVESRGNQEQFPRSVTRGPGEGFWWAFVTMTTVGYGDKFAVSPMARVLTVVWVLTSLITQSLFVASVTTSLVSQSLDVDFKLYGNKIAAIQDSFEYRFGLRRNARLNPEKLYVSYDEISEALLKGDVTGALIDTYVLGSRKDLFEKPSFRLIKIYDYSTAYGIVLGGEARKLRQCFRRYVQSHQQKIFQTIQEHVEFVEETQIPLAVERSTGLFDSESAMFETSLLLSSGLLLVFITVGAVWELARRLKMRRRVSTERDRLKLLMKNTSSEMHRTVEDFTVGIKVLAQELKAKHSKERSKLLDKLKSAGSLKGLKYSTARLSMENIQAGDITQDTDC